MLSALGNGFEIFLHDIDGIIDLLFRDGLVSKWAWFV